MQDKNDAAETFLEAAKSLDEQSILAWTMLGKHSLINLFLDLNMSDIT